MDFLKKPPFLLISALVIFLLALAVQCKKDNNEGSFPVANITSPTNCDTIYTGSFLNFEAEFSSDVALHAYAVDIHNNFDHHIHQGSDLNCKLSAIKSAFNPFIYLRLYEIPDTTFDYNVKILIDIPESIDTGDYHVFVRVDNVESYQTVSNVSIKILHKP